MTRTASGLKDPARLRPKENSVNIVVNARHMEVTDSIRQFVEGKVAKLPKYLDNILSIEVILDKEAQQAVTEIVVTAKKKHTFVATHRDDDLYTSVDQCLHKISRQLREHKDRTRDRQTTGLSENFKA
jgi:putative sigma-54 modulation protein